MVTAQLDPRWQLVLGCLGATKAPFSQGVLVKFRVRMIAHDLDQKLPARTVELAKRTGKFGWQKLQAALDSSPLRGAGRIEDTWNLIGRAMAAVVTCAAKAVDRTRAQVIAEAGLTLVQALWCRCVIPFRRTWPSESRLSKAVQTRCARRRVLGQPVAGGGLYRTQCVKVPEARPGRRR